MRWLVTLAVAAALISPTVASGQDYSFGDWAKDQGYEPGDVMPQEVDATESAMDSLDGIGEFDWTTTPTTSLDLFGNQLSSIESGDFTGLTNLTWLNLGDNGLSSLESGDFSGLTNLAVLSLCFNQLSSLESGDFTGLTNLELLNLDFSSISSIEPGTFNGLTNLTELSLYRSRLSSIESGAFSGLTNLTELNLDGNQISSIEPGGFSGLPNLEELWLSGNTALTELNLADADFSNLARFDVEGNVNITNVSLRNSVMNQSTLTNLMNGGFKSWPSNIFVGIGELDGITEIDFSGVDFVNITDLEPLYRLPGPGDLSYEGLDNLTDLWLVDTDNLDATELDVLLDNLETIEGTDTEGILYMTQANLDALNTDGGGLLAAWNAEPGHHVEYLSIGDVNHDTEVNGLDVDPFVDVLLASRFDVAADMNGDGVVNGLDVEPFVQVDFGGTQPIPEPSTLLLTLVALGVVGISLILCGKVVSSRAC